MKRERIAAVLIPAFPVALFVRDHPEYKGRPVVVAENDEEAALVVACNDIAVSEGVTPGMSVAQARMRADGLVSSVRDEDQEAEASSRLMNRLQNITPFVEEETPGRYFLEVGGMMLLYGSEENFAKKAVAAIEESKLPVLLGIAANKYVAAVAASVAGQKERSMMIVPGRTERQFLEPLSIDHVHISDDAKEKLNLLGIRTIGQAAKFAANELIHRFGDDGILLARLSHGEDVSIFTPEKPTEELSAERAFLFPLETAQAVVRQIEKLLPGLLGRLKDVSQGCGCLEIELGCENRAQHEFSVAVDNPTLSIKPFSRQLVQQLSKIRLESPIVEIRVTVPDAVALMGEQLTFPQATPSGQLTLRMPSNRKTYEPPPDGPAIYVPHYRYATLPEQNFSLIPMQEVSGKPKALSVNELRYRPYTGHPLSGMRLFQPAKRVEVTCREERIENIVINRRAHAVEQIHGPWRLSGGWWSRPFERQYYEVTINGRVYLLFCDLRESTPDAKQQMSLFADKQEPVGKWYVQGVFD